MLNAFSFENRIDCWRAGNCYPLEEDPALMLMKKPLKSITLIRKALYFVVTCYAECMGFRSWSIGFCCLFNTLISFYFHISSVIVKLCVPSTRNMGMTYTRECEGQDNCSSYCCLFPFPPLFISPVLLSPF